MRIANNIMAMNTHRVYSINNTNISKSIEKLSSGYRINRAGDDAAGLAISEKMRAQIRGLQMASKNSQDAISMVQTAEGALQTTHDILQRMREIAVQSASDTNETTIDRAALDKEFQALMAEIDDTADKTAFNDQTLIDGRFQKNKLDLSSVTTSGVAADQVNVTSKAKAGTVTATFSAPTTTVDNAAIEYEDVDKYTFAVPEVPATGATMDITSITGSASAIGDIDLTLDATATGADIEAAPVLDFSAGDGTVDISTSVTGTGEEEAITIALAITDDAGDSVTTTGTLAKSALSFDADGKLSGTGNNATVELGYGRKIEIELTDGSTWDEIKSAVESALNTTGLELDASGDATIGASTGGTYVTNATWSNPTTAVESNQLDGTYYLEVGVTGTMTALNTDGSDADTVSFNLTDGSGNIVSTVNVDLKTVLIDNQGTAGSEDPVDLSIELDFGDYGKLTFKINNGAGDSADTTELAAMIGEINDLSGKELVFEGGTAGTAATTVDKFGEAAAQEYADDNDVLLSTATKTTVAGTADNGATIANPEAVLADADRFATVSFTGADGKTVDADGNPNTVKISVGDTGYTMGGVTVNFDRAITADDLKDEASFAKFLTGDDEVTSVSGVTQSVTVEGINGLDFVVQTGANEGDELSINIDAMNAWTLGIDKSNIATREAASKAITAVNDAINQVSMQRADLGALQNRLEFKIQNLDISAENLQSAESRIRDLDMAAEMTTFTRNNILAQAATAMLAQANSLPQGVLQLLG